MPTTRYYCFDCMIFTREEQLRSDKADRYLLENSHLFTTDPLEKFFETSSPDEEQQILESIWEGSFKLDD